MGIAPDVYYGQDAFREQMLMVGHRVVTPVRDDGSRAEPGKKGLGMSDYGLEVV